MASAWFATDFSLDSLTEMDTPVPAPGPGEVTIEVRAVGMNPTDYKGIVSGTDREKLPLPLGYEVSGVISAIGEGTWIASGEASVGDEVLAFRITGGYTTALTVPASKVFLKPHNLGFPEAANLLLAGATAAEMLHVTGVSAGETILVHGASGAVGVSLLQQAKLLAVRVIGTASEHNFDTVRRFGAEPVSYGEGLEERVRTLAPEGIAAALDCVGTDDAVDVSLALAADRGRIVSIAAAGRAKSDGFRAIGGTMPQSATFRDGIRAHLIQLAAEEKLVVPMAATFPFSDARKALELLAGTHPGGKLALIP
ncbi:MAG: Alcohol dehydrogenase GroES domain protein [Glaciihabitans sp.]|nr:Alcohol dehydrogenase GroES domain protein [Glaciihabitans sp.]